MKKIIVIHLKKKKKKSPSLHINELLGTVNILCITMYSPRVNTLLLVVQILLCV